MSSHINIQICVQHVLEVEEVKDRYDKVTTPSSRKVREERINVYGDSKKAAFTKAANALAVLGDMEQ